MTAEAARAASIFYLSQTYHYFFDAIKEATKEGKFDVTISVSNTFFSVEEIQNLVNVLEDLGYKVSFSETNCYFGSIGKERYMNIRWDIQKTKGE